MPRALRKTVVAQPIPEPDKEEAEDEASEEEEEDEEEEEEETPESESAPIASGPKKRRAGDAGPQAYPSHWIDIFGTPPPTAFAWGLYRKEPGGPQEPCVHNDGKGALLSQWAIADLNIETIQERWGQGVYQVSWKTITNGTRRACPGRIVRVAPKPQATPAPATTQAGTVTIPVEQLQSLLKLVEEHKAAHLTPEERASERLDRARAEAEERTMATFERMARLFGGGGRASSREDPETRAQLEELAQRRQADMIRRIIREELTDDDEPEEPDDGPTPETWSDVGDLLGAQTKAGLVKLAKAHGSKLQDIAPMLLEKLGELVKTT